jgi:hypothetical protein
MAPFLIAGVACLAGALIMMFTREPRRPSIEFTVERGAEVIAGLEPVRVNSSFHARRV